MVSNHSATEEPDRGEKHEVAENQPEQHQRGPQDQRGQEQPALAGRLRDQPVAVLACDMRGGEDGDGQNRDGDVRIQPRMPNRKRMKGIAGST